MRVVRPLSRFAAMAIVVWILWPAGAQAAFPGRNGLLAVQPRQGTGIELVTAAGRVVRRLCGPGSRCGEPVRPRWSPDGRELVFAGPGVRIVYADGSCLNCEFGNARNPAFEPDGMLISFAGRPPLRVDAIDGIRRPAPAVSGASDAVWSAGGALATVRGGEIWSGAPDRQRRLGAGAEPSWAPNGRSLAAASRGWIVVYPGGRRLARGSNPAFSPDGRFVAYVAPGGRLMLEGARGGRPRRVGSVRAAAVDWQPVPRRPATACAAPTGSKVLASSPAAVVSIDTGTPTNAEYGMPAQSVLGCLRADGRQRLIDHVYPGTVDDSDAVQQAVVAAPYVALVDSSYDYHYGGGGQVVTVYDLRSGTAKPQLGGESIGCDFAVCNSRLNSLVLASDGVSAAEVQTVDPQGSLSEQLQQVSCVPGGTLCAATDQPARVFVSPDAAASAASWTMSAPDGRPAAGGAPSVSCPSASLCVAVGGSTAYASDDPASASPDWKPTAVTGQPNLVQVTCPSTSLCVALGLDGQMAVSADPANGDWSVYPIETGHAGTRVLCPSASECLITDISGQVIVSTDPAAGAGSWHPSPGTPSFSAGSCASSTFCVIVGSQIYETSDPINGPWKPIGAESGLNGISCPSVALCVAAGSSGIYVSTDPASGQWTQSTNQTGTAVDCPSTNLCVVAGANGTLLTSTDPIGGSTT